MRIAIPSEDGRTIARHTGRASGFIIYDVTDVGASRVGVRTVGGPSTERTAGGTIEERPHDGCRNRHHNHSDIFELIGDCRAMISFGMGPRLVSDLARAGIEAVFCTEEDADRAAELFAKGKLVRSSQSQCEHEHNHRRHHERSGFSR